MSSDVAEDLSSVATTDMSPVAARFVFQFPLGRMNVSRDKSHCRIMRNMAIALYAHPYSSSCVRWSQPHTLILGMRTNTSLSSIFLLGNVCAVLPRPRT